MSKRKHDDMKEKEESGCDESAKIVCVNPHPPSIIMNINPNTSFWGDIEASLRRDMQARYS